MPSESLKQRNLMLMWAHDPKATPEQKKVAKEYLDADKVTGNFQTKPKSK